MVAGIKALVARLRGPDAWDHARAAAALAQQATIRPSLRAPTAEAGALPLLVALLRSAHSVAPGIASIALVEFAKDTDLTQPIVDAGAVPALVALLRVGTDVGKSRSACAIAWLSVEASRHTLVLAEGALPPLVALLRSGTEKGKSNAVSAIAMLSEDALNRALIVDAGVLPPLITFLSSSGVYSHTAAGQNACTTLRNLAAHAQLRELVKGYGAVGILAAAAHASDCVSADKARATLRALCPTQDDAERALGTQHLEIDVLRTEADKCFESLALLAGPVAAGHDVEFHCEDGEKIGCSRLLLSHASPYYQSLLLGSMAEGKKSRIIKPDAYFTHKRAQAYPTFQQEMEPEAAH